MNRLNSLYAKGGIGLLTLFWIAGSPLAQEKTIHRCTQPDGSVAFQELPCAEPPRAEEPVPNKPDQADLVDDSFSFDSPFDEEPQANKLPSKDRAACEKTTRRSIDVIDAKLNESKSEDDREIYLTELLELTAQLRACKQL